jgi:hypothetical protein
MLQHPLNDGHRDNINAVLGRTPNALELAKACEHCGLDVTEAKSVLTQQHDMATKMKATFFPYQP